MSGPPVAGPVTVWLELAGLILCAVLTNHYSAWQLVGRSGRLLKTLEESQEELSVFHLSRLFRLQGHIDTLKCLQV